MALEDQLELKEKQVPQVNKACLVMMEELAHWEGLVIVVYQATLDVRDYQDSQGLEETQDREVP